jgi:hypothetical protein
MAMTPRRSGRRCCASSTAPPSTFVIHGRDEWTAQRQKSLDPIIALAKLRSWRSFIRDVAVANVARDGDTIRVAPQVRDARRIDVFLEVPDLERKLLSPTESELGAATLTAVGVNRIWDDHP